MNTGMLVTFILLSLWTVGLALWTIKLITDRHKIVIERDSLDRDAKEIRRQGTIQAELYNVIIEADLNGIILKVSQGAQQTFGYSEGEMIGRDLRMLMPPAFRPEHDLALRHYRDTGEKKIIGIGREVEAMKSDGTVFPAKLSISELPDADGKIIAVRGVLKDLTAQKLNELLAERRQGSEHARP